MASPAALTRYTDIILSEETTQTNMFINLKGKSETLQCSVIQYYLKMARIIQQIIHIHVSKNALSELPFFFLHCLSKLFRF